MTYMSPERKAAITFRFENPPRGKFIKDVCIEEKKSVLDSYEASQFMEITRRHLYRLMKARRIPFQKKGGRHSFRVIDLDKWKVRTGRREPYSPSRGLFFAG